MPVRLSLRAFVSPPFAFACLAPLGCESGAKPPVAAVDVPLLPKEKLQAELDEVLDYNHQNRRLDTKDQAAWQVLHGIVAYGNEFQIRNGDQNVHAIPYLFKGGRLKGWDLEVGDLLPATGRHGIRAIVQPGSKEGQGHPDQWLGYLAGCGLPATETIHVGNQDLTIADYLAQIEWDVPRNVEREYSWTVMALSAYHPSDYTWTASDDKTWSIEKLLEYEVDAGTDGAACGGSHRLSGVTLAVNRRIAEGGALTGGWKKADDFIKQSIATAKKFQNPDGSFSSNYFMRPGSSPEMSNALSTTGHTLEFLTFALTDEQLREPWMQRAAERLCEMFRATQDYPLECGALYHSAHGLLLYRERLFGARSYDLPPQTAKAL